MDTGLPKEYVVYRFMSGGGRGNSGRGRIPMPLGRTAWVAAIVEVCALAGSAMMSTSRRPVIADVHCMRILDMWFLSLVG
jgi:hypothetical protein